jgi:hypothetical protein
MIVTAALLSAQTPRHPGKNKQAQYLLRLYHRQYRDTGFLEAVFGFPVHSANRFGNLPRSDASQ